MPTQKLIITGCARSGTTLLHSLMSCFDDVKIYKFRETLPSKLNGKDLNKVLKKYIVIKRPQFNVDDQRYFTFNNLLEQEYRIINIIRDGRDVLVSRHPDDPSKYWVKPDRWLNAVRETIEHRNNPFIHVLKYESLVVQTKTELDKIALFLGVERKQTLSGSNIHLYPPVQNYLKNATMKGTGPIFSHSVGNWKKEIHRKRILNITKEFGKEIKYLLKELEYDI
ncbi:sulfotransferase [Spirochaetota bacterium]